MRSKPRLKMELLPCIVNAEVAQARHIRYLPRDTLTSTLEKQAKIHDGDIPLSGKTVRPFFHLMELN